MNVAAATGDDRSFHEQMSDALDITIEIDWEGSDVCELKPVMCDWCGAQILGPWQDDFATCAACGNESHRG